MNSLLPANPEPALNLFALVLMFFGILVTLLDNLGYFVDRQKIEFYNSLSTQLRCDPTEPGAKKFLEDFFYTKEMTAFERAKKIKEIGIAGTWTKSGDTKSLVGGYAVVRNTDGEHTAKLASIEEIRQWANSGKMARWIGWLLVVGGFICALALFLLKKSATE